MTRTNREVYQVFYAVDICLVVFCDSKISTAHARLQGGVFMLHGDTLFRAHRSRM